MTVNRCVGLALLAVLASVTVTTRAAEGDAVRGGRQFRACLACHSIALGDHLTGPSLYGIFGRKAGTAAGFQRYSPALKSANLVWNDATLDAWLADPARVVPGNWMTFPGLQEADARADLIAFMKTVGTKEKNEESGPPTARVSGRRANLKDAKPDSLVKSIEYCGDAYRVRTVDGQERVIWEFNLRLKTDSSPNGPPKGQPVLLPAGMQGDRASVIFRDPAEISAFIRRGC